MLDRKNVFTCVLFVAIFPLNLLDGIVLAATCTETLNCYKYNRLKIQKSFLKYPEFSFSSLFTFIPGQNLLTLLSNYTLFCDSNLRICTLLSHSLLFMLVQTISDIWSMLHQLSQYVKRNCILELFSIIEEYIHEF